MMYYPDVPALEPDELELLCHEYLEHNATLDPHLADQMGVKRGLRNLDGTGVLAGITNVSNVIGYDKKEDGTIVPIPGRLVYRGIDIDTLAAEADAHDRFMFEEVIWLLLFGSLPTQEQYAKFRKLLEHHRELPQGFADDMILNSPSPKRATLFFVFIISFTLSICERTFGSFISLISSAISYLRLSIIKSRSA